MALHPFVTDRDGCSALCTHARLFTHTHTSTHTSSYKHTHLLVIVVHQVGEVEVSQAASVHPRYPVPSLTCLLLCVVHSQLVHLHKRAHTQTQYSMVSSTTVWPACSSVLYMPSWCTCIHTHLITAQVSGQASNSLQQYPSGQRVI